MIKGAVGAFTVRGLRHNSFLALSCAVTARTVAATGIITASSGGVSVFLALEALGDPAFRII